MSKVIGFVAYPAQPVEIGQAIEKLAKSLNSSDSSLSIVTWKAMDIAGHFISENVCASIDSCTFMIADISILNFNVLYEIGYAIGKGKRVLLVKNRSIVETSPKALDVGIVDTLGYKEYTNSDELKAFVIGAPKTDALALPSKLNNSAPVYLMNAKYNTDWATRIVARVKKSRYHFRSFDPNESARMSAFETITEVSQSLGVLVPLLSNKIEGYAIHNLRASFIAGLADGMEKALCILQYGDDPVPLDYRDFVNTTYRDEEVDGYIATFAGEVAARFQGLDPEDDKKSETFLQSLNLGSSSAENEMRSLKNYYLQTDQFLKASRGDARLVVGRKGSGKSAIFLQIRDRERSRKTNIVLDLKPEGYKLIKFKEVVLEFLQEGTFQHTIMAFWEYVLLLEICHKILEKDAKRHMRDDRLYEPYQNILKLYYAEGYLDEGDFSERLSNLIIQISEKFSSKYGDKRGVRLSTPQLTELLYSHDLKQLKLNVREYVQRNDVLWLLFDNIDKGWPTSGLEHEDLLIIRALIEATQKIEKEFGRQNIEVHSIVFLRNDVYELLVRETSDKGKEAKAILDWTDQDLLKELVRLRLSYNTSSESSSDISKIWLQMCVSHYRGEESLHYLVERSLMRPRFLLDLVNHCKGFAINLNHLIIQEEDIEKGLLAYSNDIVTDICYEITDIEPTAVDLLYAFIESNPILSKQAVFERLIEFNIEDDDDRWNRYLNILLWYGFLGIQLSEFDVKYVYDVNYNMKLYRAMIEKRGDSCSFVINPAFRPALIIDED